MSTIAIRTQQLFQAQVIGTQAFNDGKKRIPALSSDLLKMLEGREIGKTPKGEATSIEIMKAFTHAWDLANLADTSWKNQ